MYAMLVRTCDEENILFLEGSVKGGKERHAYQQCHECQDAVHDDHALGPEEDVVRGSNDEEIRGRLVLVLGGAKRYTHAKHPGLMDLVVGDGGHLGFDLSRGVFVVKRQEASVEKFLTDRGAIHDLVLAVLDRREDGHDKEKHKDDDGKNEDRLFHLFIPQQQIIFIFLFFIVKLKIMKLARTARFHDRLDIGATVVVKTEFK